LLLVEHWKTFGEINLNCSAGYCVVHGMQAEVEARMSQQFLTGIDRELARAARGF
jgi:hypothetical protein